MATARYWRAIAISTYAAAHLELSAWHLYGAADQRVDSAAALTCTVPTLAGDVSSLQDADVGTSVVFDARSPGFALVWDFGSGSPGSVQSVRFGSADTQGSFLSEFTLQYSEDGISWTWLSTTGRHPWPGPRAMGEVTQVVSGDEHFDKVSLLLQVDGENGSLDFRDKSVPEKPLTVSGDLVVSNAVTFSGLNSIRYGGVGGSVVLNKAEDFDFADLDFTIELWAQVENYRNNTLLGNTGESNANGFLLQFTDVGFLRFYVSSNNSMALDVIGNAYYGLFAKTHVAVSRSGGRVRLFLGGVKCADVPFSGAIPTASGDLNIGGNLNFSGWRFVNGNLGEVRITKGVARYTDSFTPPTDPLPTGSGGGNFDPTPLITRRRTLQYFVVQSSTGESSVETIPANGTFPFMDAEFGGSGRIFGTTKIKGTVSNSPAKSRVVLLRQRDRLLVRQTWSDPDTGAWAFEGLDMRQQYIALAEDAGGNFQAVAAQRLEAV
ncbi:conserved hypothetical protein [Delftia acidovorans SPH-1]|uniref:Uncharacterized protein n=1 Tax=Delftia acidovorans (strain DSM 14801 / SPH-1) TaxID=398578 RepID=A9C2E1_DELAS|nr:LamG domain-containing protein [Delftia acidovorans]ABX36085.1 conserved hypothetical protein [Delftia acidovorans SPH-1]QPS74627.1 LamG domain-containing protein [Delftia acidovorans]